MFICFYIVVLVIELEFFICDNINKSWMYIVIYMYLLYRIWKFVVLKLEDFEYFKRMGNKRYCIIV